VEVFTVIGPVLHFCIFSSGGNSGGGLSTANRIISGRSFETIIPLLPAEYGIASVNICYALLNVRTIETIISSHNK